MFTYCTQSAQAEHMFNEARTITSVPAVACNSHMRQITTLLWSGGLFLNHSLKVWKIPRSHTPHLHSVHARALHSSSPKPFTGERMLVQRDLRAALGRLAVLPLPVSLYQQHSLTHACVPPSTETPSGSFTCTCPHKQISSREDITAFLKMRFWNDAILHWNLRNKSWESFRAFFLIKFWWGFRVCASDTEEITIT